MKKMALIYVPLILMMIFGAMSQKTDYVTGVQGEDVILPCLCGEGKLEKLQWQIENPTTPIYTMEQPEQNTLTRIETYWRKNSSDCSLGLKSITEADSNTYRCSFRKNVYTYKLINLKVIPPPPTTVRPEVVTSERPTEFGPEKSFSEEEKKSFSFGKTYLIIPIVAILLIVGCLCIAYLKRRRNWKVLTQKVTDLSEVMTAPTCPETHTWSLV